ncbi:transglutaminase domain-containing protein [Tellurirhabdus rosea]|uniref:transglutaminase domain-containing protein n=1 Tax=Tellurirhabdus rosea TaxID=2674997 RepID=UPI00225BBF9D|nr:transglutaminase domain-containing protein [Tellurirhabdus rosea]
MLFLFRRRNAPVFFTLFLAFFLSEIAYSQPRNTDFGNITKADFDELASLPDTSAEAVYLFRNGRTTFIYRNSEILLQNYYHVRLFIRKKSASDRATVSVPLLYGQNGLREAVQQLNGTTYNLVNGQVVKDKLAKDAVFTDKASNDYQIRKFTLPNVREGSILEYNYVKETPFRLRHNPETWHFQTDVPVWWSEYVFEQPEYFFYKTVMRGYLPLEVNERNSISINLGGGLVSVGTGYRFVVKNAPAFSNEPFITTPKDYLSGFDFELASYRLPNMAVENMTLDWESMDRTLLENDAFGKQLNRAGILKEAAALAKAQPDTMQRLVMVYDYIRKNIKWNKESALVSAGSRKVFEKREGDAADINLMLVALLRETGFDADPVILSTRSHGKINQFYGLLRQFNYVIAHIRLPSGQTLLLDATDPFLKPGMLPEACLNGVGRLIRPKGSTFISLDPAERDMLYSSTALTLEADGALKGTFKETRSGYQALQTRHELAENGQEAFTKTNAASRSGWQTSGLQISGLDKIDEPVIIAQQVEFTDACQAAGDRLYLKPMLTEGFATNPLRAPERLFPVDFGKCLERRFFAQITLPEGYQVEQLPKATLLTLPDNGGRFQYQISQVGRTLTVSSLFSLRKPFYTTEEYASLRQMYDLVIARHAEQIVLKKETLASGK